MTQCPVTTGNDAYHPCFRHAKGWGQFAGVEHTQSAAGTRTDIKQAPSLSHACFHRFDKGHYLGYCLADSLGHVMVFFVDMLQ